MLYSLAVSFTTYHLTNSCFVILAKLFNYVGLILWLLG